VTASPAGSHGWLVVAACAGALGVAFGAFGAHALRARLPAELLATWQTGVLYHLLHSVALLALALFSSATGRPIRLPASLWTAGMLLFCGSLALLAGAGQRWAGPVTPLGGLCLIAGWLALVTLRR
jgi:uncharacterized membrane protein YgdD (TMEM256/DUF423 family)